jgi:hypothetical protein
MSMRSARESLEETSGKKGEIERQRDRTGRLFRPKHALCQGVPEGTIDTRGEIERQRDRTGRFFRIEGSVCYEVREGIIGM